MKVRELLLDERFSDFELLAGKDGLSNEIRTVTVVDTPDGAQWLTGGEVVITTAFMLKDDEVALLEFIKLVGQKGASALCIKTGRYITEIPTSATVLADKLHLPLLSVPHKYSFAEIINPVLSKIVNLQTEKLLHANIIHTKFTELAVSDATIPQILSMPTQITGVPSAYIDLDFRDIWYSDSSDHLSQILQNSDPFVTDQSKLPNIDYYPVANKNTKFGYLIFPKDTFANHVESGFQSSVETAATNIILRELMRISNRQLMEQYRSALVHDLLINNIKSEAEIHNRASIYNWDLHSGGVVVAVDINNIKRRYTEEISPATRQMLDDVTDKIFCVSQEEMAKLYTSAYFMKLSDLIIFVVTLEPDKRASFKDTMRIMFERIKERIKDLPFTITIGIGTYCDNICNVHHSYKQARTTINLGYILDWYDCILFYDDMILYRLLLPTIQSPDALKCCKQVLSPLHEYDAQTGRCFFDTLKQIVNCNWNIATAAEQLHLHTNSMKYRYEKICKLLNMDLKMRDNQLIIGIAIIAEMISKTGKSN